MSKKSVAVRIAGNDYKILSDGDEDTLREIARYVDRAMNDIRERTGTVDSLGVSVLTCLNLARELLALRDRPTGIVDEGRLKALIDRVETAIEGEDAVHPADRAETSEIDASADSGSASGASSAEGAPQESSSEESSARGDVVGSIEGDAARTLALPSVGSLHDHATARAGNAEDAHAEEAIPEARIAAGGGERAT